MLHVHDLRDQIEVFFYFIIYVSLVNFIQDIRELSDEIAHNQKTCEHETGRNPKHFWFGRADVITHDIKERHEKHEAILETISAVKEVSVGELELLRQWNWWVIWINVFKRWSQYSDPETSYQVEIDHDNDEHLQHLHPKFEILIDLEVADHSA